jgi:nucleotide-binding universal stress UspA family protein
MKVAGPGTPRVEIGRILALTDLSGEAGSALLVADTVAERLHAKIVVGFARSTPPDHAADAEGTASRRAEDEAAIEGLARGTIDSERLEGIRVVSVEPGRHGITRLVEECDADAIWLWAGGGMRRGPPTICSAAEHAARTAGVPVFLTRGAPFPAAKHPVRVMVAVDLAEHAAVSARRVAHLFGAQDELDLVHVIPSYVYYPRALGPQAALTPREAACIRRRAAREMASVTLGESDPAIGIHIVAGEPAETLARLAARLAPDLVVLRTRAGLTFDASELGPVCIHLLRACPATLLVLPRVDRHAP